MIEETVISAEGNVFKCRCEKTGVLTERSKIEGDSPSNTEAALCDEEIKKFKEFMGDKIKTDCWCQHLSEYIHQEKE